MSGGGTGGDVNFKIGGDASEATSAIDDVHSGLEGVAEFAEGMFIGEVMAQSLETVLDILAEIPGKLAEINAAAEIMSTRFGALMSDQALASGDAVVQTQDDISAATAKTQDAVVKAQTAMSNAETDHTLSLQKVSGGVAATGQAAGQAALQMQKMAESFQTSLTQIQQAATTTAQHIQDSFAQAMQSLGDSHAKAVQGFEDQEDALTHKYDESVANRAYTFQQTMDSLVDAHAKAVQTIENQITTLDDAFAASQAKQQATFDAALDKAPDSYESQRKSAASTMKALQADLVEAQASGDGALVSALQTRIAEEAGIQGESYSSYLSQLQATQAATAAASQADHQTKLNALNQKLADEQVSYNESVAKAQESYQHDLANLRQGLADQMAAIHQKAADEAATYARTIAEKTTAEKKALADNLASEDQRVAALKAKYAQDVANFKAAEALKTSGGGGGGGGGSALADAQWKQKQAALQAQLDKAKADLQAQLDKDAAAAMMDVSYDQLPQELNNLGVGGSANTDIANNEPWFIRDDAANQITTTQERAKALYDYIEDRAQNLPYTNESLQGVAADMQKYRMDATQWLGTVTDTAAALGTPLSQVNDAFGKLTVGNASMGVREFKSMGIDLTKVAGLTFSGTGLAARLESVWEGYR